MRRAQIELAVHDYVEPWAKAYVDAAFKGDPDAAFALAVATSNAKRGDLALWCWRARIPVVAYRMILSSVWDHDHRQLILAAGGRRTLRAMFSYADFPVRHLPKILTVYRGTSGMPLKTAARGLSWTLDRGTACWFAMRDAKRIGTPLVLRARVSRDLVALESNAREEREVVLFDVSNPVVDGDAENWLFEYQAEQRRRKRERAAKLARARASSK